VSALRQQIAEAVQRYVTARFIALGKPASALASSKDLIDEDILDSVAITGLIAAVEHAIGREIDFIDIDPDALGTIDVIVGELTRVVEARL
jgi:acyl carrier protein